MRTGNPLSSRIAFFFSSQAGPEEPEEEEEEEEEENEMENEQEEPEE